MSKPATEPLKPTVAGLNAAFAALKTYDRGFSRAALLPIDEAVVAALANKAARTGLEERLITALKDAGSVAARELVCAKLAMIGSASCVRTLVALLDTAEVATAARNALEANPDRRAAKALRESLREQPASAELRSHDAVDCTGQQIPAGTCIRLRHVMPRAAHERSSHELC